MRQFVSGALEVLGLIVLVIGLWLLAPWVGLIAAGVALLLCGLAVDPPNRNRPAGPPGGDL